MGGGPAVIAGSFLLWTAVLLYLTGRTQTARLIGMTYYALIVAGGNGSRMGTELPKQFLLLHGKPVLMYTLEAFYQAGASLVLVLPEHQFGYWRDLCASHQFTIPHELVAGGGTRFHSVKNGLAKVPDNGVVAIHDGVRPCISEAVIQRAYVMAEEKGNAVAAVKLKDSIRVTDGEDNHSVNREYYWLIQTPQAFRTDLIKAAYAQAAHAQFTDDAGVLEAAGSAIHLTEGDYRNIKITTPEDMLVAGVFMERG
jgi:2-C-methyl-D-erythritol 4-phosphate cytidylyltransferase